MIPSTAAFKVPEENFDEVISIEGFTKHPHLGRHHWVHLDDINRLTKKQWEQYIKQSYQLVASKLPVKTRKLLGF